MERICHFYSEASILEKRAEPSKAAGFSDQLEKTFIISSLCHRCGRRKLRSTIFCSPFMWEISPHLHLTSRSTVEFHARWRCSTRSLTLQSGVSSADVTVLNLTGGNIFGSPCQGLREEGK